MSDENCQKYHKIHTLLYLPQSVEVLDIVPVREQTAREKLPPKFGVVTPTDTAFAVDSAAVDFGEVPSCNDVVFCYREPHAHDVRLEGDFTQWERRAALMMREGEVFRITMALADGRYLYRFRVDGRIVLDQQSPHMLSVTAHGPASVLHLQRGQRMLRVTNHKTMPVKVLAQPSQAWLRVTPVELMLPGLASADLTVELERSALASGKHEAQVKLSALSQSVSPAEESTRQRQKKTHRARRAQPSVVVVVTAIGQQSAPGLVVRPLHDTVDLGPCVRGDRITVPLDFEASGVGTLAVHVYNHGDAALHTVMVRGAQDGSSQPQQLSIPFDLSALPRREHGSCRLSIDTQSALWNQRFYEVMLTYELLFLRKRPPRLYFRRFNADGTRGLTLQVLRSDGTCPDIAIEIPAVLDGYLVAEQRADDTWQFRIQRRDASMPERLEGVLPLTDRRSGSKDHVRVIIEGGT